MQPNEKPIFNDFEEFWPHFLSSHQKAATRWAHVAALAAGVASVGVALRRRQAWPLAVGAGVSSVLAVFAHPVFEGNWPENFGYREWAARGFLRLCVRTVTGSVHADLERMRAKKDE